MTFIMNLVSCMLLKVLEFKRVSTEYAVMCSRYDVRIKYVFDKLT